jgi:prevent-host-death family protein
MSPPTWIARVSATPSRTLRNATANHPAAPVVPPRSMRTRGILATSWAYGSALGGYTITRMKITVSALRAELTAWLARASQGEEVIVTDRGVPVARLLPKESAHVIERLTQEGMVSKPARPGRHTAMGGARVPRRDRCRTSSATSAAGYAAVNNHDGFGRWGFIKVRDPAMALPDLDDAVQQVYADEPIKGLPS